MVSKVFHAVCLLWFSFTFISVCLEQRHFVISRSPLHGGLRVMRDSEVSNTVEAILTNPENESPWRYLRGLYLDDTESWINDPRISSVCLKVLSTKSNYVFALSTLLDLICHGFQPSDEFREAIYALHASESEPLDSDLGKAICHVLKYIDPMRANYWLWRKSKLPLQAVSSQWCWSNLDLFYM